MKLSRLGGMLSLSLVALGVTLGGCQKDDATSTTHTTGGAVPATGPAADDTRMNTRDQPGGAGSATPVTPVDQSNGLIDLSVTQRIRRDILADDSLSVDAKNVKVITENGVVTLRGPVKSEAERANVEAKATRLAGHNRVEDLIDVERTK